MKINRLTCAFTGHRASKLPWKYNINDKRCVEFKKILLREILNMIENGVNTFVCGCQNGADLIAGEIIVEIKRNIEFYNDERPKEERQPEIRLICIIPYEGLANNWPDAMRERFFDMVIHSNDEITLADKYYKGCYLDRNKYMIKHAGNLIAAYDEVTYNNTAGNGTLYTLNIAKMRNLKMRIINPMTLEVKDDFS